MGFVVSTKYGNLVHQTFPTKEDAIAKFFSWGSVVDAKGEVTLDGVFQGKIWDEKDVPHEVLSKCGQEPEVRVRSLAEKMKDRTMTGARREFQLIVGAIKERANRGEAEFIAQGGIPELVIVMLKDEGFHVESRGPYWAIQW